MAPTYGQRGGEAAAGIFQWHIQRGILEVLVLMWTHMSRISAVRMKEAEIRKGI